MFIKEKIKQDLNLSLKEKNSLEVITLRQLLAAILNKEKEKKFQTKSTGEISLEEEEIIEIVFSEAKKRKEAILSFEQGKRVDLAEKEKKELEILKKYLPKELSEEEIKIITKESIDKVGAKEIKDIGRVMAELMPKIKGRAEGGLVGKIVKELLNDSSK